MNTDYIDDGRQKETRYTPADTDDRILTLQPERHEKPAREGTTHAAKLASLSILFSLMVVIGSLAYIVNNRQQARSTRASVDNLYGPASLSAEEKALTMGMSEYPKTYKGRAIPENIVAEGNRKYLALPEAERKAYIMNRIVLYYIYDDVLTTNNIAHSKAVVPLTFESIEAVTPELSSTMKREYPQPDVFVNQYLDRFGF